MDSHTVIRLHSVSTARPSLSLHILPAILSHANHVFLVVSRVSGWPNIVPVLCTPITWLTKTSLTPTFARIDRSIAAAEAVARAWVAAGTAWRACIADVAPDLHVIARREVLLVQVEGLEAQTAGEGQVYRVAARHRTGRSSCQADCTAALMPWGRPQALHDVSAGLWRVGLVRCRPWCGG